MIGNRWYAVKANISAHRQSSESGAYHGSRAALPQGANRISRDDTLSLESTRRSLS